MVRTADSLFKVSRGCQKEKATEKRECAHMGTESYLSWSRSPAGCLHLHQSTLHPKSTRVR